jgi:hypothetical protein
MAFDPVTVALEVGSKLIDKFFPDPAAKAAAEMQLLQMKQTGELAQLTADTDIAKAQIAVDQAEATSSSLFVAGGRPFVIWVCGVAMANDFIVRPIALFLSSNFHGTGQWPSLDAASYMPILLGLLGLGAMRSYDKKVASGN